MVSEQQVIEEVNLLQKYFPKLQFTKRGEQFWSLEGYFDLHDSAGEYWDTFSIRIQIPKNYPKELPVIFETGGKIPLNVNWHNSNNGCCLSPDAVIFQKLGNVQLYDWFREFVISYFANFIFKKEFATYPFGEFEHFTNGLISGYQELFNLSSKEEVVDFIEGQISRLKTNRNEKCYCQSGLKFKKCGMINSPLHSDSIKIPLAVLEKDLHTILISRNK